MTRVAFACRTLLDLAEAQHRFAVTDASGTRVGRITSARAPRRAADLVGGSLYWIIAHSIVARQQILAVTPLPDRPGAELRLALPPIPTIPTPRRAHQGWRYLEASAAPPDLDPEDPFPLSLRRDLATLGLW